MLDPRRYRERGVGVVVSVTGSVDIGTAMDVNLGDNVVVAPTGVETFSEHSVEVISESR